MATSSKKSAPSAVSSSSDSSKQWFLDADGNIPSGFSADGKFDPYAYDPGVPYKAKGRHYRLKSNPNQDLEDPFDLDNLRFINKALVMKAFDEIERLAATTDKELVCMIATGGTIAMSKNAEGKLIPKISPEYLLQFSG